MSDDKTKQAPIPWRVRDDYFVVNSARSFVQVSGAEPLKVDGFEEFDFFIHHPLNSLYTFSPSGYVVSEGITGAGLFAISSVDKQDAIARASNTLTLHGRKYLQSCIDLLVNQNGLSPRYSWDNEKPHGEVEK